MNAQQLKNAILQEAITGRLVPQDPNDEPASVLLDRIRKEKAKLVKEGKLKKKDLEEKPISKEEIPFEIPESWEWVRIGYVCQVLDIDHKMPAKVSDGIPYISPLDFYGVNGINFDNAKKISLKDFNSLSKKCLPQIGDIIFPRYGTIGVVRLVETNKKFLVSYSCATIKIYTGNLLSKYLYYVLQSPFIRLSEIEKYINKTTQPNVGLQSILKFILPLPPLAEQHRIVAKIEELLPKVEEYGKAQEALDKLNAELPERLKKSILQEAITGKLVPQDPNDEPASVLLDKIRKEKARLVKEKKIKKSALKEEPITDEEKLFSIPTTWEWCKLGWIGDWGAGATPAKGTSEFYTNGTIPWLRTGELNNGVVSDSEIKVTPYALQKCSLRECQVGDVLIAMYGATIGKVAIAGIKLTTNQACCACTPYQVYNKYLLYYLMASKQRFIDLGEGGAQPNISREKIIAFPFPLPPLAEQHRIVAKIEELLTKIDKLKTK